MSSKSGNNSEILKSHTGQESERKGAPVQKLTDVNRSTVEDISDVSPTSNASNYKDALGYQIDPRTGNLQISISPPAIPGLFGQNITPTIHYTQQTISPSNSMLGLPLGWMYHYTFVSKSKVFINGQSSYFIDGSYDSGMRYYNLKNVTFREHRPALLFPYGGNREYVNTLHFYNGDNQYIDEYGRLIGIDDRFGNNVSFWYDTDGNIYQSRLVKIVDSYGQETTFTYSADSIQITYPKGGHNVIGFTYLIGEDG
jgi:hypothetical protein